MIELEGLVTELLPDTRFRIQLDNGHAIIAYTAGRMRKNRIKTLAGDRVTVEMSAYDLTKGRIIFRHKDKRPAAEYRSAYAAVGSFDGDDRMMFGRSSLDDRLWPAWHITSGFR